MRRELSGGARQRRRVAEYSSRVSYRRLMAQGYDGQPVTAHKSGWTTSSQQQRWYRGIFTVLCARRRGRFFVSVKKEKTMTIIDLLNQNASLYGDETALVEINPCFEPESRLTWKDYSLM